jgi:hypothetical protein
MVGFLPTGDTDGDALNSDEAATIADTSTETIRRHCAESEGDMALGVYAAGIWLISRVRLLNWIEQRDGQHARLAAESRAAKLMQIRAAPRKLSRNVAVTT